MTIFDWINQILVGKKHWDEFSETDQKKFSPFIINRWLSMDSEFVEVVNYFQKYSVGMLSSKDVYEFYRNFLPRGKRFNKYIKGKKLKKYNKELINVLVNYFECSKLEVQEYLELLPKQDLVGILERHGIESKQIRKLIK